MTSDGVTFVNSSILGSTALAQFWVGGFSLFEIAATQFGAGVSLQKQIGTQWVPLCSSFVASQVIPINASAGQYRLVSSGSSIGMTAVLSKISD